MKTRLIVVDDFYPDPDAVRVVAQRSNLEADPANHKGIRSVEMPIPEGPYKIFEKLTGEKIKSGYSCFQLCIAGDQLVYHSDEQRWAAVVFLTPNAPPETGTSFFKSRATGFRSGEDLKSPEDAIHTYGGKLLDRTAWDEVDRIGNVYNRLAIWDARLIHSASDYFGTGLDDARLFQMYFWDSIAASPPG
jgi:hypothetical protein